MNPITRLASLLVLVPGLGWCGTVSLTQSPPAIPVAAPETLGPSTAGAFPVTMLKAQLRTPLRVEEIVNLSDVPEALRDTTLVDPTRATFDAVTRAIDPLGAADPSLALEGGRPHVAELIVHLLANAPSQLLRSLRADRIDPIATGGAVIATEIGLDDAALAPSPPAQARAEDVATEGVDARAALIGLSVLLATVIVAVLVLRKPDRKPRLRTYRARARAFNARSRQPGQRASVLNPADGGGPTLRDAGAAT